ITDKNEIENIIKFHKDIVNCKTREDIEGTYFTYLPIEYNLKNGSKLRRAYRITNNLVDEYYSLYANNLAFRNAMFPITDNSEKNIKSVSYNGIGEAALYINIDDYDVLLDAVKSDVLSVDTRILKGSVSNEQIKYITIYYQEKINYNGINVLVDLSDIIPITDSFKNTKAIIEPILEKPEYANKILKASDIKSAKVECNGEYTEVLEEDVAKIYEALDNLETKGTNENIVEFGVKFNNSENNYVYIRYNYDLLPDILKKYIKN
ncbi:MAG: DUF6449 domain-containing protein, partial [Lachnospirales bacterium]